MTPATKNMLVIGFKLALFGAVSAVLLGSLNAVTKKVIEDNKEATQQQALSQLVSVLKFGPKQDAVPALLSEQTQAVLAYYLAEGEKPAAIITVLRGTGYGGDMILMAAYKSDGELIAAVLLDNLETPGLGKKAEDQFYMRKFIGKGGQTPLPISKAMLAAGGTIGAKVRYRSQAWSAWEAENALVWFFGKPKVDVDSVTGATITFNGVSKALKAGSDFVKQNWGE